MTTHDTDYPWFFRRDDVDLLEDELEDLYGKYGRGREDEPLSFEAQVLEEQMDTEEQSDADLALKLGMEKLREERSPSVHLGTPSLLEDDLEDDFTQSIREHPLYRHARAWATQQSTFAKQGYERGGVHAGAFFRAYANVNLVPIKIFLALCEEDYGDRAGAIVAHEAFLLALTFLGRVRESLSSVLHSVEAFETLERLSASAHVIEQGIHRELQALRERNTFL
ncbi:hypothetical protein HY631_01625 [Candidatus Uhrbacteria bacterium]|nr:hypothetical protein [Candidatus Uhrbacteria bacterium]